jgi:gentisate 1,2-dioxygenase
MMTTPIDQEALEAFYRQAGESQLAPMWPVTAERLAGKPKTRLKRFLRRWSEFGPLTLPFLLPRFGEA